MPTEAVRHAIAAGDWPLAAVVVVDDLAIGQILEPQDGQCLAGEFASMPSGEAWTTPQPYLLAAAVALSAGQHESCAAALDAADGLMENLPADEEATSRLAAAVLRLTACLRAGDLAAAASAVGRAELMLDKVPAESSPGIRTSGGGCCPAAPPSSCGPAAWTRRRASSGPGWPTRLLPAGNAPGRA